MKKMNLTLEYVDIKDVQWGEKTAVKNGVLYINKAEAAAQLADKAFADIDIELARPGESVRIIPVKDVIEPRVKADSGEFFPGFLGKFKGVGDGITKVLRGCCVVTTGSIVCYQEGIIDMSGPSVAYNPFGKTNNVVLKAEPVQGISPTEHEAAVRLAGIKLAHYLAKSCMDAEADESRNFMLTSVDPEKKLPRVMYVNLLLAQGLLHDNYLYGSDAKFLQTMLLHPNELLDGAIVSGNCVTASDKNTTYDHLNNPVLLELYNRHGKDLEFCGVITTPSSTFLAGKEKGAASVASIASLCGVDALIITEEGGGNPEADIMMIAEAAEARGIKCVLLLHETAGERGDTEQLVNSSPVADAVVTAGNKHEYIDLPKMEKIIGHAESLKNLAGYGNREIRKDGSISVRMAVIIDAISNLGTTARTGITY